MLKFKEVTKSQTIPNFPVRIIVVRGTEPMQIGSDPLCDVRLDHADVEPCHAVLFYHENCYWLRNVSSTPLTIEAASHEGVLPRESATIQPQQEMALSQPIRFQLGDLVLHIVVPALQPTVAQVHCSGCGRSQDSTRSDCLWCGRSLAFSW